MPPDPPAAFPETRWSLVLRVQTSAAEDERSRRALNELCAAYWYPLYAFARRREIPPAEAEDLTQGFFALLISRSLLDKADRERGRLRSFLIGVFKLHIADETRREQRLRRGGGQALVSLDQTKAEEWFIADQADGTTPEQHFDRDWAEAVVDQAMAALETECAQKGKAQLFARLREFLSWDQAEPEVASAARDLGMTEGALRVAVHRLRHSFRQQLQAQVAQTVTGPDELQAELDHLFRTLLRE
ncbi:hypothetical protein AYO41_04845 [Verrucomicrobia bacterium SCGC AG-212-E04]|nr:hypothetical protein AYO41_04845 [Verrucomicrobia bacterium SCGC AG-212-E04]